MIELLVPNLNANEDTIVVSEILKENNEYCQEDELICIFETTKSSVEFNTPIAGFIWFNCKQGDELKVGDIFCYMDTKKIQSEKLVTVGKKKSKLMVTNKAQELIDLHTINSNDIKKAGIIKLKDVNEYISKTKK